MLTDDHLRVNERLRRAKGTKMLINTKVIISLGMERLWHGMDILAHYVLGSGSGYDQRHSVELYVWSCG